MIRIETRTLGDFRVTLKKMVIYQIGVDHQTLYGVRVVNMLSYGDDYSDSISVYCQATRHFDNG